jgi:hypothetical protein
VPWTEREWSGRHQFFRDLPSELRRRLPSALHGFTYKPRGSLAQVYFRDPRVHYEAWFHWRTGRLELGLHFERDERTNDRLFQSFDRYILQLKDELGQSIDLERWDKGWARLYETWPCEKVDDPFRARMSDRFARIIVSSEPILDEVSQQEGRS